MPVDVLWSPPGGREPEIAVLSLPVSVKTLDRYLIREIVPPFLLALGMFTFLLAVRPMLDYAQDLLVKGLDLPMVAWLLVLLLPQALGVTIPMALMAGLLMGLGRLSADREAVAFLACGVSPLRLLRPVMLFAVVAGAADMYLLTTVIPDANQKFREQTYQLLVKAAEVKPGVFHEGFPGKVIYVRDRRPDGHWTGVMLAETSQPGRPTVTFADEGYLALDPKHRQVAIVLPGPSSRYIPGEEEGVYDTFSSKDFQVSISPESLFGDGSIMQPRGNPEMHIAELREAEAKKRAEGISPHPEILQRHQMFSFPVACLVFALVGVALGVHTRKEGKLGGFTLGVAIIFIYYGILMLMQNLTKGGQFPAEWARWVPDIVVGLLGLAALRMRTHAVGSDFAVRLPNWATGSRASQKAVNGASVRPVLVIRMPEIHWPFPSVRVLDRYVARRYLSVSVLSFFAMLGLYYIGTFLDKSERLFKGQATAALLLQYFYYSTPQFIADVVPMATLVAALATIGGLTRTGELIVMRACGVSLYRSAAPLLVLSLLWGSGLFMLDDRVLAHANRKKEVIDDQIRGNLPHSVDTVANANWQADGEGRFLYYTAFDTSRRTLHGLSVFDLAPGKSSLVSHTMAPLVSWKDGAWHAENGWTQTFSKKGAPSRETFVTKPLSLAPPERFAGLHNNESELMTFGELRQHIAQLGASGVNLTESQVQLQERVAFPMVTLVMTLLGVPFGVTTGRRGALYGVGLAIILGASYWLFNTFFVAVGQAGLLSPVLAAWASNILFLALAGYATLTVRT
jgi:LPS export ABC transporter permease LptG/LPS export ABC transporter permease LptF